MILEDTVHALRLRLFHRAEELGNVEHPLAEAKESANFRDPRGGPGQSRTADTRIFSRKKKP